MIREALAIIRHVRNAERKHPSFPELIAKKHTTSRAMTQRMNSAKSQNDSGGETISSVLEEECAELMCAMHKRRWRSAESELLDVVAVCWRIYKFIRAKKRERYNRVVSYLRYKMMLERKILVQEELFPDFMHNDPIMNPMGVQP